MTATFAFGGFALCTVVIVLAGRRLADHGDRIAGLSGWSGAWVGLALLASVTSLPELVVGVSSAGIVGAPDLAVGDVLGSCAFNLLILAAMDAFVPQRQPLLSVASTSHVLAAALGVILLTLVGVGLFLPTGFAVTPWIGVTSIAFIGVYVSAMRLIYLHARRQVPLTADPADHLPGLGSDLEAGSRRRTAARGAAATDDLRRAWTGYALFGAVILVAGLAVPYFAEEIAVVTGLGESFVGTLFLAASTSLPELAVSVAAVRSGAIDLAVGNLLGSNLFNVLILAIDDVVYTPGLLLKDASDANVVSVLSTVAMSAVVIIGLTYRVRGKRFLLAWDAALVLVIYVANLALLLGI